MNEYQINVSTFGKHLFRTEWTNDAMRCEETYHAIVRAFPHGKVSVVSRNTAMTQIDWSIKL